MGINGGVMRILWLTIDRSKRVASHIFNDLRVEVSKYVNVETRQHVFQHPIWNTYKDLCEDKLQPNKLLKDIEFINNNFDIIFTDAAFAFLNEDWNKIKIKKCMLLEDQHGDYVKLYMKKAYNHFDYFFVRYFNPTYTFHPYLFDKKVFHLPHSIDENKFKNLNIERTYNVLSIGAMNKKRYKIRNKAKSILENVKGFKQINRPKEDNTAHKYPIGSDYINILNKTKSVISCTADVRYTVIKTFEIPACGGLLLSDISDDMKKLGFKSEKNCIDISSGDILDLYEYYVLDEYRRSQITSEASQHISKNHTTQIRAQEFIDILKGL